MNTELRGVLNQLYEMMDLIQKLLPEGIQRRRLLVKLADSAAIVAVAGRDIFSVQHEAKEEVAK